MDKDGASTLPCRAQNKQWVVNVAATGALVQCSDDSSVALQWQRMTYLSAQQRCGHCAAAAALCRLRRHSFVSLQFILTLWHSLRLRGLSLIKQSNIRLHTMRIRVTLWFLIYYGNSRNLYETLGVCVPAGGDISQIIRIAAKLSCGAQRHFKTVVKKLSAQL